MKIKSKVFAQHLMGREWVTVGVGYVVSLTTIGAYVEGTSRENDNAFREWFPFDSLRCRLVAA